MTKKDLDLQKFSNFIIFQTSTGKVNIDVFFKDETLWLTQKMMAELFEVKVPAISKHLKNIFETGELEEKVVVSILENTTEHGAIEGKTQTKSVKYFNLKAILSVGYRVNSNKAIEFRKWANNVLEEYIVKGFAMDDDKYDKKTFWEEIIKYTENNIKNNTIIIGDYNTGFKYDTQYSPFILGKYIYELVEKGWIDVWNKFNKKIDFTWYSNKGNGFRIDHIFTTQSFENSIINSYFSHKERKLKYSDHSMLLAELKL